MKHKMKLLSLALCAALMLSVPALAAETPETPTAPVSSEITAVQPLPPVRVWGKVTKQESGSLLLNNADKDNPNDEIIVHLPEAVPFVDGTSGEPLSLENIKDGDTLYIWLGPAMTMSLPPQSSAVVLVGNVPDGGTAPQYAEITAPARVPDGSQTERRFPIAGGELTVSGSAEVSPYLTRNRVTLDDLIPGTHILAWTGENGKVNRILSFPYAYSGYLTRSGGGAVRFNGELLEVKGRVLENEDVKQLYLPLRAAAKAAGYKVDWVSGKGAVVSENDKELFSVLPGSDTAQTADGEHGLLGGCVVDAGVTYLPAADLASLLNLYFYTA